MDPTVFDDSDWPYRLRILAPVHCLQDGNECDGLEKNVINP